VPTNTRTPLMSFSLLLLSFARRVIIVDGLLSSDLRCRACPFAPWRS
jgi:hypothetical protein